MYINDDEGTDFDASPSGQFSPQQLHHFIYLTVGHNKVILWTTFHTLNVIAICNT